MTYDPVKCCKIILACMILHNICINLPMDEDGVPDDIDDSDDDREDNSQLGDGHERPQNRNVGVEVRRRLVEQRFTE